MIKTGKKICNTEKKKKKKGKKEKALPEGSVQKWSSAQTEYVVALQCCPLAPFAKPQSIIFL